MRLQQYFDNIGTMELKNACNCLAALGHETRLVIFRLLVEAGPQGLNASVIANRLELPAATLSFHLAHLRRTGLIFGRKEGRFICYMANYAQMDSLIVFMTGNCCQGAPCLPKTAASTKSKSHDARSRARTVGDINR